MNEAADSHALTAQKQSLFNQRRLLLRQSVFAWRTGYKGSVPTFCCAGTLSAGKAEPVKHLLNADIHVGRNDHDR